MMALRKHYGIAVACSLFLNACFILSNFALMTLVVLPFYLQAFRGISGKAAWRVGYVFGLAFGVGQLWWLAQLTVKWTGSLGLAAVPLVLATGLFALYFGLTGVLIQRCWAIGLPILIPFVWAGIEVFRSYIPVFAFPWGLLATPFAESYPFPSFARIGLIFGGSFFLVLVSLLPSGVQRRPIAFLSVGILVAALGTSFLATKQTENTKVAVAQTGVDMAFGSPEKVDAGLAGAVDRASRAAKAAGAQLLFLPEGISDTDPAGMPTPPFKIPTDLTTFLGVRRGHNPEFESAYVAEKGRFRWVDKTRLVVFGEFVPLRDQLPFLSAFRLPSGDMTAGLNGTQALKSDIATVGPMVCFESLFPDIAWKQAQNGAQILWVPAIHDWFAGSTAPQQLRQAAIWRATENGMPLVQSTPTGKTFAVQGDGFVAGEVEGAGEKTLVVDLKVPTRPWSNLLPWILPATSFLTAVVMLFAYGPLSRRFGALNPS